MNPPTPKTRTSRSDVVLSVFFVLAIVLPLAAKMVRPDRAVAAQENRRLARFPKLDLKSGTWTVFPAAFEKYYDDQFGFRDLFIRWHHLIKLRLLGVSPSPKVVLGKDGWLFDRDTVQYYGAVPLSAEALGKWREFLEERQRFVAAKGFPFLIVFAPLPSTIYPEYLPDQVRHEPRESRLDQLIAHLRTNSSLPVLDCRRASRKSESAKTSSS